jgi:hypothetical protein
MNKADRIIQIIAASVLVLAIGASGVVATAMSAEAGRAQLAYTDEANEGDPPEVALGIAMGAFRGLFVNYLWLRANRLKEDGKFYEAIELSSVITRLQPRFPRVWVFHAWNMAYNISVATYTPQERWLWVNAGVNLLRDQAIPRNPNDVLLHKELAWMFLHKIQGFADDANRYYKRQLAREWTIALGTPPLLNDSWERSTQQMVEFLSPVVEAPDTLEGVIEAELAARTPAMVPGGALAQDDGPRSPRANQTDRPDTSRVAELVARLRDEAGLGLGQQLLELIEIRRQLNDSWYTDDDTEDVVSSVTSAIRGDLSRQGLVNEQLNLLLADPRFEDAWERLVPHVRKRVLIDDYNMEPRRMLRYTRKFGPLDWRHPCSHAIYWSHRGVEEGLQRDITTSFSTLNTDRVTLHAIQELWRDGTVYYDIITGTHFTMMATQYAEMYGRFWHEEVIDRVGRQSPEEKGSSSFAVGYENFLRDVIRVFYRLNQIDRAREFYEKLRTYEYQTTRDQGNPELSLPLDKFVEYQIFEDDRLTIPHVAASEIEAAVSEAMRRGLLGGDREMFNAGIEYARKVHERFWDYQAINQNIDPNAQRMQEMPRDFAFAVGETFFNLIQSSNLRPTETSRLYQSVPLALQQLVYDDLVSWYARIPNLTPEQVAELFPEPAGMEQFRAKIRRIRQGSTEGLKADIRFETQ